jgi:hypothetical protein
MWVLLVVFLSWPGISTQQIGFYETKEECLAATKLLQSGDPRYGMFGECLPSKGTASYE